MNILDYFKYAALSTAAYVRMGDKSLDGATFADEASSIDQSMGRLPLSIAQYLFDPQSEVPNANKWTIADYHADDKPGVEENSGFAATLYRNSEENVLAIRGAEAGLSGGDIYRDLIGASIGEQVSQMQDVFSTTRPPDCTVVEPGNVRIRLAPRRRP